VGCGHGRSDELRELDDLARLGVDGERVRRQNGPKPGVGEHGGVADAVDGVAAVAHSHRMDAAPPAFGEPHRLVITPKASLSRAVAES
jgi:hypothetical protein